jgi:hypothetical protein
MGQRNYTVSGVVGSATGTAPGTRRGGGFVGAATDAEADRAMQDRVSQMQAAQVNIAQMNTAADAQRDLRAVKLGVTRNTLDQLEGRAGPAAPAGGQTFEPTSPFAGTGFGDEVLNRDRAERNLNAARGFGAGRRNQRAADVYNQQIATSSQYNQAAAEAFARGQSDIQQSRVAAENSAMQNAAAANREAMQQAGLDRRAVATEAGLDRRAVLTAELGARTKAAELGLKQDETSAKAFEEGNRVWAEVSRPDSKGNVQVSHADFLNFSKQVNPQALAKKKGISVADAQRILAGQQTADEARWMAGATKDWKQKRGDAWWFDTPAPADQSL